MEYNKIKWSNFEPARLHQKRERERESVLVHISALIQKL